MIIIQPSTTLPAGANGLTGPLNLHERLEAATEALLKTRDQVVQALDHHLLELDTLRRALASNEKPVVPALPAAPIPQVQPPMAESVPLVPPHYFERPPSNGSSATVMPLLTQVLWPSKAQGEMAAPARAPMPPPAAPVSSPLVAYSSMAASLPHEMAMSPDLEKATLEELNAALAQAFNQVSRARAGSSH